MFEDDWVLEFPDFHGLIQTFCVLLSLFTKLDIPLIDIFLLEKTNAVIIIILHFWEDAFAIDKG